MYYVCVINHANKDYYYYTYFRLLPPTPQSFTNR